MSLTIKSSFLQWCSRGETKHKTNEHDGTGWQYDLIAIFRKGCWGRIREYRGVRNKRTVSAHWSNRPRNSRCTQISNQGTTNVEIKFSTSPNGWTDSWCFWQTCFLVMKRKNSHALIVNFPDDQLEQNASRHIQFLSQRDLALMNTLLLMVLLLFCCIFPLFCVPALYNFLQYQQQSKPWKE